jgi:hypothetical protein
MKTPKTPKPIGRKALREALDTVPIDSLFSPAVSKELTGKQKAFCKELAKGNTKAGAYRKAYNVTSKATMHTEPYKLASNPAIANEVEAMKAAIAAQEYQTPAALRSLVIHSLVKVITDPESKPGQITAAAKVLGTVTEVAAFTARSEQRIIRSSDDARAELMAQIRELSNAEAVDVTAIDQDADSLLAELAVGAGDVADSGVSETHRTPTPQTGEAESLANIHTIPHEQDHLESIPLGSHSDNDPDDFLAELDPPPSTQDDPPSSFKK